MVNIGILEIKTHAIDLSSLCRIANVDNTNITVFTKEKIWKISSKYLNAEDYNVILMNDYESESDFLKRVETYCNNNCRIVKTRVFIGKIFATTKPCIYTSLSGNPNHIF